MVKREGQQPRTSFRAISSVASSVSDRPTFSTPCRTSPAAPPPPPPPRAASTAAAAATGHRRQRRPRRAIPPTTSAAAAAVDARRRRTSLPAPGALLSIDTRILISWSRCCSCMRSVPRFLSDAPPPPPPFPPAALDRRRRRRRPRRLLTAEAYCTSPSRPAQRRPRSRRYVLIHQLGAAPSRHRRGRRSRGHAPRPLAPGSLLELAQLFSRTSSFGSTSSLISIRFETIATRCEKRRVDIDSSGCASSATSSPPSCAHTEWGR